jgi:hypothetical protein
LARGYTLAFIKSWIYRLKVRVVVGVDIGWLYEITGYGGPSEYLIKLFPEF